MRSAIVARTIDTCSLLREVSGSRNGASVLFVGTVRDLNDGSAVSGIDYSAYATMAERELAEIVREASSRWGTDDIVVEHRIGTLEVADASVVIAVAHPHRDEAYQASRYVIEELKKRLPIWKREHYLDGRSEWVAQGAPTESSGSHTEVAGR
ncbi:MAG TPA: molybdenum cofactor biosynthesis protein MoaE [Gemmatimonadaceae bacterium]|nr:molybdenum cofactor biosynthesis protein MoaE [Gemmatimonadaceae bacterium]